MSDSAKTLWNKLRKMIHDLSKVNTSVDEGLDVIISNLRNAASLLARIRDPPLITKDYMYNIVELAKSTSIAHWYVNNVVEGHMEFITGLKEESDNIVKLARKLYYSYKNRFKLLAFHVLTPLIIACLDIGIMGTTNTLNIVLLLSLAGLSIVLLPISTRGHGLALMTLSLISIFIIPQVVKDILMWTIVFLYSVIGVITGFMSYYASNIRDKLRVIVNDILSHSRPLEEIRVSKETTGKAKIKEIISDDELYGKLLREYYKLYGANAKEILDYRIGLLLRSGFSRRRALGELAKELDIKDR